VIKEAKETTDRMERPTSARVELRRADISTRYQVFPPVPGALSDLRFPGQITDIALGGQR